MEKSAGTKAFIAEFHRLLDRCVAEAKHGAVAAAGAGLDLLFDLLRYVDECDDDVIFFADEAGSWQVGVQWETVFPVWFRCLTQSLGPEEYAHRVLEVVDALDEGSRGRHLGEAERLATEEQRGALRRHARRTARARR